MVCSYIVLLLADYHHSKTIQNKYFLLKVEGKWRIALGYLSLTKRQLFVYLQNEFLLVFNPVHENGMMLKFQILDKFY